MALAKKIERSAAADPIRVMVVDDSAVVRGLLSRLLEHDDQCAVIASASNGKNALKVLERNDVDVLLLDIEMPVMDGLTALPLLLELKPSVQIIMVSTLTTRSAHIALEALALGAKDYIAKPTSSEDMRSDKFSDELLRKVAALGQAGRKTKVSPRKRVDATPARPKSKPVSESRPSLYRGKSIDLRSGLVPHPSVIAIGSSTGGPAALSTVVSAISPEVQQPILITQHMPATFTKILAQRLGKESGRPSAEAANAETIKEGHIYVAPGDFHMTIAGTPTAPKFKLLQTPPENFCRPAVDPMLRSLSDIYGSKVLTVILTGMGHDGLQGSRKLADLGGAVIAQDEATSTVWGMPGAVATEGVCNAVVPLEQIGELISKIATSPGGAL